MTSIGLQSSTSGTTHNVLQLQKIGNGLCTVIESFKNLLNSIHDLKMNLCPPLDCYWRTCLGQCDCVLCVVLICPCTLYDATQVICWSRRTRPFRSSPNTSNYCITCLVSTLKSSPNLYFLSELHAVSTG